MPSNAPLVRDERQGLLAFSEHQRQAVRDTVHGLNDVQPREAMAAEHIGRYPG